MSRFRGEINRKKSRLRSLCQGACGIEFLANLWDNLSASDVRIKIDRSGAVGK